MKVNLAVSIVKPNTRRLESPFSTHKNTHNTKKKNGSRKKNKENRDRTGYY